MPDTPRKRIISRGATKEFNAWIIASAMEACGVEVISVVPVSCQRMQGGMMGEMTFTYNVYGRYDSPEKYKEVDAMITEYLNNPDLLNDL